MLKFKPLLLVCAAIIPLHVFAWGAMSATDVSPEAVLRVLASRQIVVGAGTTVDGATYIIRGIRADVRGEEIVITIKSRRMKLVAN